MKKLLLVSLVLLISGCAVIIYGQFKDYQGNDYSMIRVTNDTELGIIVYKEIGNCYKRAETKLATAALRFMGLKSTHNKKIDGMLPPSSELQNKDVFEYKIKAGQPISIFYDEVYSTGNGTNTLSRHIVNLLPEEGHDYDIYTKKNGIIIIDLSTENGVARDWNNNKCNKK